MKPKHRVFCLDAQRSKMLFDTEKQANTFIKFNGHELCDNPEEKLSVYWCNTCGGYHITSHKYNPRYGQNTRELVKQYNEYGKNHLNVIIELIDLLKLHNNSIKFNKSKFKIQIREIIYEYPTVFIIYGERYNLIKKDINEILDYNQIKTLLGMAKQQIQQNESQNNMKKDNKKALYENIMTSVAKEVKKALNEGTTNESLMDRWDNLVDTLGAEEMCNAIFKAMSHDEIESMVNFLERMYLN